MTAQGPLRILLADDHVMVRDGLKRLINDQPDVTVVAEAGDGVEALRLAEALSPDVALVDVSMPGWDGVTLAQEIVRACPDVRILAVTRHDDEGFVRKMLSAGASGYVLKQSSSSELVNAVRAIADGRRYIDRGVRAVGAPMTATDAAERRPAAGESLTDTEEQVLRLVASSLRNQSIAERMRLEPGDVAAIKQRAMEKAGLMTRIQVFRYAQSRGWVDGAPVRQPSA